MNPVKVVLAIFFFSLYKVLDVIQYFFRSQRSIKVQERTLSGHLAPVQDEFFRQGLPITEGKVPFDLNGEFVRNGPNAKTKRRALGGHNWFDGDGMLHGVRIKNGKVSYVNRFVKTTRSEPFYFSVGLGEFWGIFGILKFTVESLAIKLGVLKKFEDQTGSANTSVVFHAKKFFALVESNKPTLVKILEDGELETIGMYSYNGNLKHNFTAHPKIDTNTGEMMTFGYKFSGKDLLTYSVIDKEGNVKSTIPISLPRPVMMHDIAITTHYSIFFDLPLVWDSSRLLKNKSALIFDKKFGSRIGIIHRHSKDPSSIRWFTVDPCYMFHSVNAWEEGDVVVIFGVRSHGFESGSWWDDWVDDSDSSANESNIYKAFLYEWRINLKTGEVEEQQVLANHYIEFPQVHPDLVGVKNQFCYFPFASNTVELEGGLRGMLKFDLWDRKICGIFRYPRDGTSGEAVFVPRENAKSEDDGYLLTFIHYAQTDSSQFIIMDAKTMSPRFLTSVDLPQRVPFGFHGMWISEEKLASQE